MELPIQILRLPRSHAKVQRLPGFEDDRCGRERPDYACC
jgi:hypothetical protein